MHDPFAMRPFFGYNFGEYLQHWLSMPQPDRKMPKIFHVNWFRKSDEVISPNYFIITERKTVPDSVWMKTVHDLGFKGLLGLTDEDDDVIAIT